MALTLVEPLNKAENNSMMTDYIHIIFCAYENVLYNETVHKPSIFNLEVVMENGTVHKPSIFTSEVIMEAESPPNH